MIPYVQTNTVMACSVAAFCSGLTANSGSVARQAQAGVSAGSTEGTFTVDASASNLRAIYFELVVASEVYWDGGDWVIRFNVTTGAANVTWASCFICRVDSGCTSQATIASKTSIGADLSTTGVKSTTVTGGATQAPSAGDKIIVVCSISNGNACTRTLGITPNQNIDAPFSAGEYAGVRSSVMVPILLR